jgi:TPR repeat protein
LARRETAIDWCRAAAERGYARGQVALGQLLMGRPATMGWPSMGWMGEGDGGQRQGLQPQGLALLASADPAGRTEAVHWFRQAAAQGDAVGRLELARAYAEGRGVAQDPETAAQLLAPLAASARPDGEYARALIARYGLGTRRSTGLANRALQQSADGNFWLAQADLAALYAGEDDGSADDGDVGAGAGRLTLDNRTGDNRTGNNRTGGTKAGNGTVTGGAMSGTAAQASTGVNAAAVSGEAALPRDPDLAAYWRAKAERGDLDSAFFPLRLP